MSSSSIIKFSLARWLRIKSILARQYIGVYRYIERSVIALPMQRTLSNVYNPLENVCAQIISKMLMKNKSKLLSDKLMQALFNVERAERGKFKNQRPRTVNHHRVDVVVVVFRVFQREIIEQQTCISGAKRERELHSYNIAKLFITHTRSAF